MSLKELYLRITKNNHSKQIYGKQQKGNVNFKTVITDEG